MALIGISGKISSGKDTVSDMIRYLTSSYLKGYYEGERRYSFEQYKNQSVPTNISPFNNVKFADALKDMVCILLNCTREQLEDRDFKEKELGEEWWYYGMGKNNNTYTIMIPYLDNGYEKGKEPLEYLIKLTPRKLLQLLGTECGRNMIHPNIWVNALMNKYVKHSHWENRYYNDDITQGLAGREEVFSNLPNWIISDMRFPNELKAVKAKGGITIRIERFDVLSMGQIQHESETALDDAKFDYTIINDGSIEDLLEKVKQILIKSGYYEKT